MSTQSNRHYKSAPITEAVIEIRVQPAARHEALTELATGLKSAFPKQAPMHFFQLGIAHQPGNPVQQSLRETPIGYRLTNEAESRVLQLRQDTFVYSHMAPYSDWETFKSEARPLWQQYRTTCAASNLQRCALRYINRIDIPAATIEPEDFFWLYPNVPAELPQQNVIGSSLRLMMPQEDLNCVANIRQRLGDRVTPGHISFVLDIDIFRLDIGDWNDDEVWRFFEDLRNRKNQIFEACITDRTRELFDK